jgi:hypothetical protein
MTEVVLSATGHIKERIAETRNVVLCFNIWHRVFQKPHFHLNFSYETTSVAKVLLIRIAKTDNL